MAFEGGRLDFSCLRACALVATTPVPIPALSPRIGHLGPALRIFADLAILWFLWPAVLMSRSEIQWPPFWSHKILTLASLIPIGLAFMAGTFPGEGIDKYVGQRQWIPLNLAAVGLGARNDLPKRTSVHDLLFNGEVDEVTRRRKSLFSNTLVLPGFDVLEAAKIDDPKKLDSVKHTWSLRRRHLEDAVFNGANLRKVDFTGAYLEGARFDYAGLERASLGDPTQNAQTLLVGAHFRYARLQNAILVNTQLQGADLYNTQLQGALLNAANLQGAMLEEAQLQSATLLFPHLQGAVLKSANLQGAKLRDAELQGASLVAAQLQGADFQGSTLAGTTIDLAEVWRMSGDFENASSDTAFFCINLEERGLSTNQFAALTADIMKDMPEGARREDTLKRIEKLNPDIVVPGASQTEALKNRCAADHGAYQKALADQLKSLVCSKGENSAYIVRGLIANERIKDTGDQAPGLVEAILTPDCLVSAALTQDEKAALNILAEEAKPRDSK
jgi:uncharacterized protein YjbI with pentapeptide repeats